MNLVSRAGMIAVTLAMVWTAGCTKETPKGDKAGEKSPARAELQIRVPEEGSITERMRSLWGMTMPVIRAEAFAGLSDDEYQARRIPLYSAWVTLQQANANAQLPDKEVEQLISEVLGLIDHVYGFPGTPAAEREARRQDKARTQSLLDDIGKRIQTQPAQ